MARGLYQPGIAAGNGGDGLTGAKGHLMPRAASTALRDGRGIALESVEHC